MDSRPRQQAGRGGPCGSNGSAAGVRSPPAQPLHRLGEARRREGLTRREVARRLGISIREVQELEQPSSDVPLSALYRWQKCSGPAG